MAHWFKPTRTLTRSSALRHVKLLFALLAAYLIQMCVMPYFSIAGVTPSVLFPLMAIVIVAFGKCRGFWAGSVFGILLETMQPTVRLMNLLLYPVSSLLCGVICADKTTQQLEYEKSIGKVGRNVSPLLRTPLCALLLTLIYDTVNLVYIYLRGSSVTAASIGRGVLDAVLSVLITLVVMVPIRHFFGYRRVRREVKAPKRYEISRNT